MDPAITEGGWQGSRRRGEEQGAAAHRETRIGAQRAEHRESTRDHARGAVITRVPFDQDAAAAQAVAAPIGGVAAHDDRAAPHALAVAGQRRTEKVAGVAGDVQEPALHLRRGERAAVAADGDTAAAQAEPEVRAGVALDLDRTVEHALPDAVELVAGVAEDEVRRVFPVQVEQLVDAGLAVAVRKLDGGDVARRPAREPGRCQRGTVDALARRTLQHERERAHPAASVRDLGLDALPSIPVVPMGPLAEWLMP